MENRRPVTEEDLLATEALIADSYGRLKRSVAMAPYRALRSAGETAREHPLAAAAVAAGGALLMYQLLRPKGPRSTARAKGPSRGSAHGSPDLTGEVLSMILPIAAPYIAGYVRDRLGGTPDRKR